VAAAEGWKCHDLHHCLGNIATVMEAVVHQMCLPPLAHGLHRIGCPAVVEATSFAAVLPKSREAFWVVSTPGVPVTNRTRC